MPRLFVCGDTHGDLTTMYKLVERYEDKGLKIDGVIQVGDLGVYSSGTDWKYFWDGIAIAPKPTLAILGNHEDIVTVNRWVCQPDKVENIKLALDGRIENFLGVRIGAIWGNYSPISYKDPDRVFQNRMTGQSPRIAMHINRYSVETLLEQNGPMDMLITHDSAKISFPDFFKKNRMDPVIADILGLVPEEINHAAGCPGFDDLLTKFKPKHYLYGHLHIRDHMRIGATEVDCLQAIQYNKDNNCFKVIEI